MAKQCLKKPPANKQYREKRDNHGNIKNLCVDPAHTCGRRFLISEAFKLGYKKVYFPLSPGGSIHWMGVCVEQNVTHNDETGKSEPFLSYEIHDTSVGKNDATLGARKELEQFLRTTFAV